MWKIDPKDKHIYNTTMIIYIEHICNRGTTPLWNLGEKRKEKRMIAINMEIHYICAGRRHTESC
jgi:hypothetical protein